MSSINFFTMDSVSVLNPKLVHTHSLNFNPLLKPRAFKLPPISAAVPQNRLNACFLTVNRRNPLTVVFAAAPQQDSEHGEVEVEKEHDEVKVEKGNDEVPSEESQEAWKQALDTFKEQALKLQGVSQEAYEVYSKKAIVILKDTSEQLKIQAEKAGHDLSVAAKEITEEGKDYLHAAAVESPEMMEIVDTLTRPDDDLSKLSGVRDFYVGVPYGLILSLGGFLSFMVTGSIAAIRFGIILGGILLALSIQSLKSYKRGERSSFALKGQTAIASILFLREISSIGRASTYFTALISGAVVAFYVYRLVVERNLQKGRTNLEGEAGN